MDLLLSKNTRWKIPKITHARHFVSHFPRKVLINNYRFQPLVVSATLFYPVWRGLDNIRSNPWSTRDTSCSTWETKITASCRSNCHSSPCVEMHKINIHFHAFPIRVMKLQWFRRQDKDEGTVVVAVTAALCLGLKPSVQYLFWGVQDPVQWDTVVQKTETKWRSLLLWLLLQLFVQAQDPQITFILRSPAPRQRDTVVLKTETKT